MTGARHQCLNPGMQEKQDSKSLMEIWFNKLPITHLVLYHTKFSKHCRQIHFFVSNQRQLPGINGVKIFHNKGKRERERNWKK